MIVTAAYLIHFGLSSEPDQDPSSGDGMAALLLLVVFMAYDLHMAQVVF